MSLDNPLWQYALKLYARPGVEQAALELQQAGCSINRLLTACYLGQRGLRLMPALLEGEALEWQRELTHPVRVLRYRVRNRKGLRAEMESCYHALREAELACEQVELMLLWETICDTRLPTARVGVALIRSNLEIALSESGVGAWSEFDAPLQVLIEATLSDPLVSG